MPGRIKRYTTLAANTENPILKIETVLNAKQDIASQLNATDKPLVYTAKADDSLQLKPFYSYDRYRRFPRQPFGFTEFNCRFGRRRFLNRKGSYHHDNYENQCDTYAVYRLGNRLASFTGDARYGNWSEKLLYNSSIRYPKIPYIRMILQNRYTYAPRSPYNRFSWQPPQKRKPIPKGTPCSDSGSQAMRVIMRRRRLRIIDGRRRVILLRSKRTPCKRSERKHAH